MLFGQSSKYNFSFRQPCIQIEKRRHRMNIKRWSIRVLIVLAAGFVLAYLGDWGLFKLRGSPQSAVTVNLFQTVPLKGNKEEYDYLGSQQQSCSESLFPHAGLSACWQLRRNPNQTTAL
jgi:hypothetical protein